MAKLSTVAQSKLDKIDGSNGAPVQNRNRDVNKDLPLAPDEIAGLREQKRQYTKELQAAAQSPNRKPEIDPNHAYPTFAQSSTLILSTFPHIESISLSFSSGASPCIGYQMRSIVTICLDGLQRQRWSTGFVYNAHRHQRCRLCLLSNPNARDRWD